VVQHTHPVAYRRRVLARPWPAAAVKPMSRKAISSALRSFLQERLPEHMVPNLFLPVHRLPLLSSGKVDRGALPAPVDRGPEADASQRPRTPLEEKLARIWCEILGVSQVGLHDHFFSLGGDSILTIQVVAKARQAGIEITPRQVFERPTISELAKVVGQVWRMQVEQGPVTGRVALTPIQRRFFANPPPQMSHFNQSRLFEVHRPLVGAALQRAVRALMEHHDALRLRFVPGPDGWEQRNAGPDGKVPWICIDLSELGETQVHGVIEAAAEELQRSLDITVGPLLRVSSFDLGSGRPGRLWIAVHHLAMDDVSWPILLEDLETSYGQASRGDSIRLPAKTTSFLNWAERLEGYGRSDRLLAELAFWAAEARRQMPPLPVDFGGDGDERSSQTVRVELKSDETEVLLREVPAAQAQILDALLAALAQSLDRWRGAPGPVLVDLEGHGREEELFDGVDLTRTVGWFTALYPVLLDLRGVSGPAAALQR